MKSKPSLFRDWIDHLAAGFLAMAVTSGVMAQDARVQPGRPSNPSSNAPAARGTNAPSAKPSITDYQSVARLVADRNIFDPDRQPRTPGAPPRTTPKPQTKLDSPEFGLVGVMNFSRGAFAFFDGNASEYRKALQEKATIAGYQITSITPNAVTLTLRDAKPIELKIGTRLKRTTSGAWEPAIGSTGTFTVQGGSAEGGSTATPASGGGGAEDEILKRLLKKREQEMK